MINREALDRYCERGILGLVLAILVFGPLALGAVRLREFAVIELFTAGVGLLWAGRLWLGNRARLLWPPICWAVLAFTIYAVVRYFTADIEYLARQEVIRVIVYATLFFAILNNLHRQETMTVISFTLIFLGLAVAGYAVYQHLAESDLVWNLAKPEIYAHRASGTYFCPNHLGGFLEMLVPLALAYTLAGRLKPVTRVLLGYAALIMLAGIAASVSRGAWMATTFALALFVATLMFRRQFRLPAVAVLIVLVAGGAVFYKKSYHSQKRVEELVTSSGELNDGMRFSLWHPALQIWRDHPWWGAGPAHFDARFRPYRPEGVQATPDRAHNDYLNTLADWGVAGLALVLSALTLLGLGIYKTWRSRRLAPADLGGKLTSNKYAFMLGASLGLVAILVHSVVDFNMQIPANAILAITLMALLTAHLRFATENYWYRQVNLVKVVLTLALMAAVTCLLPQARRGSAEFALLQRAAKSRGFPNEQLNLLKEANRVEPMNAQTAYEIAENYRQKSQEGGQIYIDQAGVDYRNFAEEALRWFKQAIALNPFDSRYFSGAGWCLDWLDRPAEAVPFFDRAEELDPNNYFNLNRIGLHFVQRGEFAAAKPWFERSQKLQWAGNDIAGNFLQIIRLRLLEAGTNDLAARFANPTN